jgi:thiol-disulfide isomerase/thioredoxin
MKNNLFTIAFLLLFQFSFGQDAKVILKQSYQKCQTIQNGYYEMTRYEKKTDNKDTLKTKFYCSFKKLKDDSIYSSAFHHYSFFKDTIKLDVIYTGVNLVTASSNDSSATIMSKPLWSNEIRAFSYDNELYNPLTDKESSPIQHDSDFNDNKYSFKFIGKEKLNGVECYHIKVNVFPKKDSLQIINIARFEFHYWIKKQDSIPIQYSTAFDWIIDTDTMYKYQLNVLNKYDINNLKNEDYLTLNSIPTFYNKKDYVPVKNTELLSKNVQPDLLNEGTVAPNWELNSLNNEKISLKNLEGQLVLIDFFYKACNPCLRAIPVLEALSQKYKNKGLRVIGIDPYDKKDDEILSLLSKIGVTYTVCLGGKNVEKDYHVKSYPTIFLIDKKGKIIFVQEGCESDIEAKLERTIKKNL